MNTLPFPFSLFHVLVVVLALFGCSRTPLLADSPDTPHWGDLPTITVPSSLDGHPQRAILWASETAERHERPLLVFLHSWSGDYTQDNSRWHREAVQRDWIFLHPDFRGPNRTPKACGSRWARQDILDAIEATAERFQVDRSRIYLAGSSGGGHMAMLIAGHHADRFSAVSAWVGISDLAHWYHFHTVDGSPGNYARMIRDSLRGPPGASAAIDEEYRDRSPIFHLHRVGDLPLDLAAGVRDGKSGSVPIRHTLNAFNVVARANGTPEVTDHEIETLWETGALAEPEPEDIADDPSYGRALLLRRRSGSARVTIFDGDHESLPPAACEWLANQRRPTKFKPSGPSDP